MHCFVCGVEISARILVAGRVIFFEDIDVVTDTLQRVVEVGAARHDDDQIFACLIAILGGIENLARVADRAFDLGFVALLGEHHATASSAATTQRFDQ